MTGHTRIRRSWPALAVSALALSVLVTACAGAEDNAADAPAPAAPAPAAASSAPTTTNSGADGAAPQVASTTTPAPAPAAPAPVEKPYAYATAGNVQGPAASAKNLIYVPNQVSSTVQVIDPATYTVVDRFSVGRSPEHVVPSHDLKTLWVNSDTGDSMTPIDPTTGKPGKALSITDPYNLYFTPDGKYALIMAERLRAIVVRDAQTMQEIRELPLPCGGVNHADFTADLKFMVASCEFSGELMVMDADATQLIKRINLNLITTPGATPPGMARSMGGPAARLQAGANGMPQDVRLTPDGRWFLAADMVRNGVWVIDAQTLDYHHFIQTGKGAHGIYPSRDGASIYVTNRDEGTVSVLDTATLQERAKWSIPGGGSPDMGGVTADGKELWLSGRYSSAVYVFNTATGEMTHKIKVDAGPHGLLVWPQPGRFSLGHTGNMR